MENIRLLQKKGGEGAEKRKKKKREKAQMQLLDLKIIISEIKI